MTTALGTDFRTFFGNVPTAVTAIVSRDESGPIGMIVGTFASVSVDPPLVSFMVTSTSRSWAALRQSGRFTANILASDQRQVCETISGWAPDKFRDISLDDTGVIDGCLAWAACEIEREIEAGDHTIVLARPIEMRVERSAHPLIFARRQYHRPLVVEDLRGPGWE